MVVHSYANAVLMITNKINFFVFVGTLFLAAGCGDDVSTVKEKPDSSPSAQTLTPSAEQDSSRTIVFFGNSLTAGYGLQPEETFPALIQDRLDSLGYDYQVLNAGVSGETSSGGLSRVDWVLKQPVDIFILELGGNDGLRGIPPEETKKNLQGIIDKVEAKYPEATILLAGMEAPPNMGPEFTTAFRQIYPELARANSLSLIPFLLEDVGGETGLNQPDGIHPNAAGARIVAENVWEVLQPELEKPI